MPKESSLRSKCFQRVMARKLEKKGGVGERKKKMKRLPANPTILENAPRIFQGSVHL